MTHFRSRPAPPGPIVAPPDFVPSDSTRLVVVVVVAVVLGILGAMHLAAWGYDTAGRVPAHPAAAVSTS